MYIRATMSLYNAVYKRWMTIKRCRPAVFQAQLTTYRAQCEYNPASPEKLANEKNPLDTKPYIYFYHECSKKNS